MSTETLPARPQLQLADLPDPGEQPPPWRIRYKPGQSPNGIITIPRAAADEPPFDEPVTVSARIAARLAQDGPEIAHAYLTLAAWSAVGESVTIERYLMETWGCIDFQRVWPLVALHKRGLLISPIDADERDRDHVEVLYGNRWLPGDDLKAPTPPNRIVPEQNRGRMGSNTRTSHQVPPDPWPTYTGERWTGTDIESARSFQKRPVVYCLYGADGELLYIGSTGHLRNRLRGHREKPWTSYVAHGCRSRSDADWLEAAAIRADRPPLNRDYWCAGKLDVVPAEHVASAGCVTR